MPHRKIINLGHSSAITIPKEYMQALGWKEGQEVDITMEGDKVVMRKD